MRALPIVTLVWVTSFSIGLFVLSGDHRCTEFVSLTALFLRDYSAQLENIAPGLGCELFLFSSRIGDVSFLSGFFAGPPTCWLFYSVSSDAVRFWRRFIGP